MTFCYSPWTNLDISPNGIISPCCKFTTSKYKEQFNLQTHSIGEYFSSDFLEQIKQDFKNNEWPDGCERCRIEEENNISSKRQLDYERWASHYDSYDQDSNQIITASIAFGNTCNLKCITCNSNASSRWQKEYQDIYHVNIEHFKFYKKNFVNIFTSLATNLVHIDLPGGEPFLSGVEEQKELLNYYIQSGQAPNITLHYTTNGTIFPGYEWWNLWKSFKEIDLQLSVDGIEKQYEYIRFPASWETFVKNAKQYIIKEKEILNLRLSVSHTVSAYNIMYLDNFFNWCYNIGLPRPWLGRVHNPNHMRPSVWGTEAKTLIINTLLNSQYEDVKVWANLISNTNDDMFFKLFKQKLKEHDEYRGLNFSETFPELANYI